MSYIFAIIYSVITMSFYWQMNKEKMDWKEWLFLLSSPLWMWLVVSIGFGVAMGKIADDDTSDDIDTLLDKLSKQVDNLEDKIEEERTGSERSSD